MTEIPEHLLKRSRDRRSALGDGGDDAAAGTAAPAAASSTPATTTSAEPAVATSGSPARGAMPPAASAPAAKPDIPVVAAYKRRKRVPAWAMMGLATLPVWALLYVLALTSQPVEATGPLGEGAKIYTSNCSSCHTAGPGYSFTDGDAFATFPHIEDQLRWVMYGTDAYKLAGIEIYGNPDRPGGPHITGALGKMPAQAGVLTDAQILAVVCDERYSLGGVSPDEHPEEFELWCADHAPAWVDLEAGGKLATLSERIEGTMPIGDAPKAGSPAS